MLYPTQDMPFTSDGIVPDIIMNPHAVPSRMTIGQLMECILGKACVASGELGDASPFTSQSVEAIGKLLASHGLHRHADEVMYNPRTGEQVPTAIFIGPTYYQRLKHMTVDKVHCLTPDHEVLTTGGWIPIADVTLEDRVATLVGERLVYECPLEVLHFPDFNGKLYSISNNMLDLQTTLDHRMWVSVGESVDAPMQLVPACEIVGKNVRYQRDATWDAPDYQFVLPGQTAREMPMDAWLLFFGTWMAAGWVHVQESTHVVIVTVHDELRTADMLTAIDTLGVQWWLGARYQIVICDEQMYKYFAEVGDESGQTKRLPEWVWMLSAMQAGGLMEAMLLHDRASSFFTPSSGLADDIMRLALHAGLSANRFVHTEHMWRVSIVRESDSRPNTNACEEIVDYTGSVHCLRVHSEVFMVRRNGKPVWTGNSRAANGPVVLLTRQPAEGRARDGGLRLGEMEIDCHWAHGMMHFLKERFMECSDNYRVFVCRRCGMMAPVNPERNIHNCKACKNTTHFCELRIPYAAKLLVQEIQSMSIATRFLTSTTTQC